MTRTFKSLIVGAVLALLLIAGYKACSLYDRNSVLKGEYDALRTEFTQQNDNSKVQILGLRNIIAHKDERMRNITSHIEEKEGEISTLHAETDKLESAYATLEEDVATVDNLQLKVDNLTEQVNSWKLKFTLAEGIIQDQGSVIFNINAKYEAQVKISLEWEAMYDNEVVLHNLSEVRRLSSDKKIMSLKFGSTIKNGIVVGLAAAVVYGLVR